MVCGGERGTKNLVEGSLLDLGIFLGGRGGERMRGFLAGWGTPPPSALVGKTLMFDYLTKTSIINLKEFTVNSKDCVVWESNLSIRTQK